MRKCVRCNTEMNEELEIKVDMQSYGISVSRKGIFGKKIEKPQIAICPECGEISFFIKNINLLRK